MDYEARIKARIEELKAEREQYIAQANQQIAAYIATYNGAIQALEQLLSPVEKKDESAEGRSADS